VHFTICTFTQSINPFNFVNILLCHYCKPAGLRCSRRSTGRRDGGRTDGRTFDRFMTLTVYGAYSADRVTIGPILLALRWPFTCRYCTLSNAVRNRIPNSYTDEGAFYDFIDTQRNVTFSSITNEQFTRSRTKPNVSTPGRLCSVADLRGGAKGPCPPRCQR